MRISVSQVGDDVCMTTPDGTTILMSPNTALELASMLGYLAEDILTEQPKGLLDE